MTMKPPQINPLVSEHGSTLVLYAILLTAIFVVLTLGFGVVGAMTIRTNQESALSVIQEQEMNPARALVVKNAADPGMMIARAAVDDLRECGINDPVEVWFYEVPARELSPNRRIYAFEVVLTTAYRVPFGGPVGIDSLDISSSVVTSAMPYAEFSSWRPSAARSGVFKAAANSSAITFEGKALTAMPKGIKSEIASDLDSETP